jgi:hypothetical protein
VPVPNQQNAYIKVEKVQTQIHEEFEDTKEVIRICISKKNRQRKSQKKKDKQRSTNHTQKYQLTLN